MNVNTVGFGNVAVGSSGTQAVSITNSMNASVQLTQASFSNNSFSLSGLTVPSTLSAGQTAQFSIKFLPSASGTINGSLTITDSASTTPISLPLSGTGVAPQITMSPASLGFGNVTVGTSAAQSFSILNAGVSTLDVSQIVASGSGFTLSASPALPLALAPNQSATVTVKFAPQSAGAVSGAVTVTSNAANGSSQTVSLSGAGTAAPAPHIAINPASLAFGNVTTGTSSSLSITLSNTGSATLNVSQQTVSGTGFSVTELNLPLSLNAGQSSSFSVVFFPAISGTVNGKLTITSSDSGSPATVVPLSGTGVAPAAPSVNLNPKSLTFGSVTVGSSASLNFSITDSGGAALHVSQVSAAGTGFTLSAVPSLPLTLQPNQSATVTVKFAPQSTGGASGMVTVTSDASNGTSATVALSGSGAAAPVPHLSLMPNSASFGNVVAGSNSSQSIKLSNSGNATLNVTQDSVTGTGFSVTGLATPLSLSAGQSTNFNVVFAPKATGGVNGNLTIASNDPSSPNTALTLTGTGVAATFILAANPNKVAFGNVMLGSSSSAQSVSMSNSGNSNISISQISVSGAGFSAGGVATPVTLAPGQTTSLSITFAPTSAGSVSGAVTVTSNSTSTPSITLSGTGVQPISHSATLSWNASTSAVVGYNVYRSMTSGGSYTKLTSTAVSGLTFTDSTVQAGQTYFYVVTAVDSNGNESNFSSEVSGQIPTP